MLPIVYISGRPLEDMGVGLLLGDRMSFLQKPIQPTTLLRTIQELLSQ
jgi:hypothetical protein